MDTSTSTTGVDVSFKFPTDIDKWTKSLKKLSFEMEWSDNPPEKG